jgi:uncharacterized protein YggT (Ycf19 family)
MYLVYNIGMKLLAKVIELIAFSLGILIALRVVLKFFGASTQAPFVAWLYETTDAILYPFLGMFPTPVLGGLEIDLSAMFGMAVILAVGYVFAEAFKSLDTSMKRSDIFKVEKKKSKPPEKSE